MSSTVHFSLIFDGKITRDRHENIGIIKELFGFFYNCGMAIGDLVHNIFDGQSDDEEKPSNKKQEKKGKKTIGFRA